MHEIAEKGYAAHFKYKHGEQKEQGIEDWLNRLQEALGKLQWQCGGFCGGI